MYAFHKLVTGFLLTMFLSGIVFSQQESYDCQITVPSRRHQPRVRVDI